MNDRQAEMIFSKVQPLIRRRWASLMGIGIREDGGMFGPWLLCSASGNHDGLLNRKRLFSYAETNDAKEMVLVYAPCYGDEKAVRESIEEIRAFAGQDGATALKVENALMADEDGYVVLHAAQDEGGPEYE